MGMHWILVPDISLENSLLDSPKLYLHQMPARLKCQMGKLHMHRAVKSVQPSMGARKSLVKALLDPLVNFIA